MVRYFPVLLLCLLAPVAAPAQTTMEWLVLSIDWGGVQSSGDMKATGLPAVQSAREAARRDPATGLSTGKRAVVSPRDSASGLPTGKRRHAPIRIRKMVDKASPLIQRAHRTRQPLPRILLKVRNPADKRIPYLLWELKQARISSYSVSGSSAAAMEQVTLVYQSIQRLR